MGGQEVYICYDGDDELAAEAVCYHLEDNDIKCWLKSRDSDIKHEVEEIMDAIRQSKVLILLFSEYAKQSIHVKTEVDLAFTEKIPIISFKIEKSKLDGSLEFFLKNAHWIDAYPNVDTKFHDLIRDTSRILGKPISDPVISEESRRLEEKSDEYLSKRPKPKKVKPSIFSRFKIPIIALVIILIVGAGIFAFMNYDDGIGGSSEAESSLPNITMKISDFHVDDVRKQSTSWNFSYFVSGTIFPAPDGEGYKITVDFYDKEGKLVDTTETAFEDAQKLSDGYIFGSYTSDTNDVCRIEVQLVNKDNIVVAQCEDEL